MSIDRVRFLVDAVPVELRDTLDAVPHLAATLECQLAEISAAWRTIYVDDARYLRRLAGAIERRRDEPARRVIETMPAADLYLAAACMAGDAAAIAVFRDHLVPGLRQALGTFAIPPATIDETVQHVLVMLFVGDNAQIAGYTDPARLVRTEIDARGPAFEAFARDLRRAAEGAAS